MLLLLLAGPAAWAQLTGVKAIPGDYPTLRAAITDLNTAGAGAGGVTFNIAAGYTETAANLAITATGTAANPIVFQKAGTGANPKISAGVGTGTLDAIIALVGSDYVTLDGLELAENAANTTTATQMEFGIALFRPSATDGCQYNVIRNCTVTLNKANTATFGIYGAASTAAASTSVAATAPSGANSNNRIYANTVSNAVSGMYLTASTSTAVANYDLNNEIGVTAGNTVTNFGGAATSGWGIGANMQNGLKIANNTVNSTGGTTGTSTLRGIYGNTGTSANVDITNNVITLVGGATSSAVIGIDNGIGSTAAGNTVNITGNTIQNSTYTTATSGAFYAIQNTASAATVNITGNTISGNASSATSGAFMAIRNTATQPTLVVSNNVISNNTLTGSGEYDAIFNSGTTSAAFTVNGNQFGSTAPVATTGSLFFLNSNVSNTGTMSLQNNVVRGLTKSGAGGAFYGYYNASSPTATQTISGNTFADLSVTGATTFYGLYLLTSTSQTQNVTNNTVSNITGGTSEAYGLYIAYGANGSTVSGNTVSGMTTGGNVYGLGIGGSFAGGNVFQNTISGISSSGASSTVAGLQVSGTTNAVNVYRNKVYDVTGTGATPTVSGILVSGGTNEVVHNNLVGGITAPAASGYSAVNGISVTGGTAISLYYNSVYLNATSSSNTFGTSGIYFTATPGALDLRNNIVVNKSTAAGSGYLTAALRRSAGTAGTIPANLSANSNNNLYYAGTPSATNVIYAEGGATVTNAQQTLAAYKNFVVNREGASVTEDVPFVSTTGSAADFLHVSTTVPTQVEGAAMSIAAITADFDGDVRSTSTPDIGADEGIFQPQDLTGPSITFTPLGNTTTLATRTLTAIITDPSGVATGANAPRLYFRKGTSGAFQFVNATTVNGTSYTFTFDYALLGGVSNGEVVQYYLAAQDLASANNTTTSPAGGSGTPPGTTGPSIVYQYNVLPLLSGTYYVGTSASPDASRTFATLTAAANAYNNSGMGGAVTFVLLDASYSAATGETFPIAFGNNPDASANNTLTIRPNAGVTATITAAGSVLALSNARYVTINGSNNGSASRNLTLTTSAVATGTYNLALISTATTGPGNQSITVKNLNTVGGGTTSNTTYGLYVGNGPDNDNVTLQNNSVVGVSYGIYTFGSANVSAGGMDNLVITGNVVGPATAAAAANIGQWGIYVSGAVAPSVTGNEVQNVISATTTNVHGIYLADVRNGIVSRNSVHNVAYTGSSTTKVWAINTLMTNLSTAANPSALRIDNNLVYNITSSSTSSTWNTSGINLNAGYGDKVYFNTVYLSGALSAASGTAGSAAFSNGNPSVATVSANVDVRNNIFVIIGGTGGTATTPLYAHYTMATSYTGSTLNNNDLFVTTGSTGAARIGRFNAADAVDLAAWRTATGQEANSVSVNPNFTQVGTAPYDLTPTAATVNNVGDATTGVTVDYTGATRGNTPDLGAYEFTPATIDVMAGALISPAAAGCYGASEAVTVSFTNNAATALDLALNPVTVTVVVTPPSGPAQTFTATVNTGTLAASATQNVTLPGTLNMSAAGSYSFAITTTTASDATPGNDQATVTRTVVGVAAQPQLVTFTGFTGSNLTTVFPGWYEATGVTLPTPAGSGWTNTSFPAGNTTAKINLFSNSKKDWIVSPKFLAGASTVLTFDAGITEFGATTADPAGMTGTDDFVEVRISTDCGATFARIPTFSQFNAGNQPSNGSLTSYSIDLSPYAGQQIILSFFASEGTADDLPDYDFHLDNISVSSPLPIDLAPTALVAPAGGQTCYSPTETVTVTVQNKGTQALDFAVNPASVSVVVTTPAGPQTLTTTLTTGTLAPNATQNVTLPGTLDMSAAGAYSFAVTATVQGDQTTSNDALAAVTRTVVAPVAGTLTTNNAGLCNSGTAVLTLTGAANGTIQWQQSADNVTFTDISGATTASYTTPVLTSTTYFRVQVRCNAAVTSNVVTITVNTPLVSGTNTPLTVCEGTTATLTATGSTGATLRYFEAATGGTALGTGASFTTPALTASRQYFVEAVNETAETVGKASTTGGDGGYSGGNTGLVFNATSAVTIQSVTVYPSSTTAGSMTVELRSSTGTVIATAGPFAVPASSTPRTPLVLPLNLSVPAAGTYRLVTGTSPAPPELYRDFTGSYPYTSPSGAVSITGGLLTGSTSTTYYFFYNWQVLAECVSATRTPIQVNVTPAASAAFSYANSTFCQTSGTNPAPTVTGTTGGTFSSTTGLTLNASTGVIDLSASTPGTYTVTYTAGTTCTASTTDTVTVEAAPVRPTVSVSYPSAGTAVLSSSSATGNQWYLNGVAIPGATGPSYTANGTAQPGAYTVVVSSAQGCASQASLPLTVTASSKPLAGSSLQLFPNPTPDGQLTLQLSGYHKAVELTVLNAVGQVVYRHVVPAGQAQLLLDLRQQPTGVYILRAATDGGTDTRRIVRQ
ncbi:hypothetical protein B0919_21490 [Hymenobacter sp. CRA2]|nr:hypothetical protein B0919_21490 [Hymenobacter sp. CRA2]